MYKNPDLKYEIVNGTMEALNWDFLFCAKGKNCACSLANQAYSNELLHFPTLCKAGVKAIQFSLK